VVVVVLVEVSQIPPVAVRVPVLVVRKHWDRPQHMFRFRGVEVVVFSS
jgi:hypothetical protein